MLSPEFTPFHLRGNPTAKAKYWYPRYMRRSRDSQLPIAQRFAAADFACECADTLLYLAESNGSGIAYARNRLRKAIANRDRFK